MIKTEIHRCIICSKTLELSIICEKLSELKVWFYITLQPSKTITLLTQNKIKKAAVVIIWVEALLLSDLAFCIDMAEVQFFVQYNKYFTCKKTTWKLF